MIKTRKRYTEAEKKSLIAEIKKDVAKGMPVMFAVKSAGVSYWTYRKWEKEIDGKTLPASRLGKSGGRAYAKKSKPELLQVSIPSDHGTVFFFKGTAQDLSHLVKLMEGGK